MAASKTWRRLKGENQLPKVVAGVIFRDGTEVTAPPERLRHLKSRIAPLGRAKVQASRVLDQLPAEGLIA